VTCLLRIPKSTHFNCVYYIETNRQREDNILKDLLWDTWQNYYRVYGAPCLRLALVNLNLYHGINRIRRLMREAGIYSVISRRFSKPITTVDYSIRHLQEANA